MQSVYMDVDAQPVFPGIPNAETVWRATHPWMLGRASPSFIICKL